MFRRLLQHRYAFAIWLSTAMYLFIASGIPIYLPELGTKDVAISFPCMANACGCRSAEQCWRSCCCYTIDERLTWAKAHGVTPPAFVLAAAKKQRTAGSTEQAKCAKCGQHSKTHGSNPKKQVKADSSVILLKALVCQGIGHNWLVFLHTVPLKSASCSIELPPQGWLRLVSEVFTGISPAPPDPPPRLPFA